MVSALVAPHAAAEPGDGVRVVSRFVVSAQREMLTVHSAAMREDIPLTVLRPKQDRPAPVLYLLNGAGGGEDGANWAARTDYVSFFADKHVNVVTPMKGAFSYYTDWQRDDPRLGRQKWETFLTRELPPLIDRELGTTRRNAIAGISMAGTSVLNLAARSRGLYRAAASYSGCARTSDPVGQAFIRAVVEDRGKADMTNMWGPLDGPGWRANDPLVNAEKLRGTAVYLSSNTGLPGEDESLPPGASADRALSMADQVLLGGGIEFAVNVCTQQMADRLAQLKIPAVVRIRDTGTHSWGYWERELKASWPTIRSALTR
ncbi:esterase family protein [Gordonia sp. PP30]|uniref:alpha/beta hydrolase n=1 Tax=Gordonia sp. PP30 TaxID=2935861 RepID=UPI0020000325|nr:alpha/beta hydrolase family protein [Gordonia sp. PP30]UQE76911.1 esterase family protein [Gordonia sp. PP30]